MPQSPLKQGLKNAFGALKFGSSFMSALARACNSGYNMPSVSKDRDSPRRAEERGKRKVSLSSGSSEREDAAAPQLASNKPRLDTGKVVSRSPGRDDDSYTYDTTPEQEKNEKKEKKEKESRREARAPNAKDVRDRDRRSKVPSKNVQDPKDSKHSNKDDEEGMNCPICNKWLKNRYEAWKSHQKTSVRCATRRGETDTRKECKKCGKWVANNHFSWMQHKPSCKADRLVLRDNRDRQDHHDNRDHHGNGGRFEDRDDRDRHSGRRREDDQVSLRGNQDQRQDRRWKQQSQRSRSPPSTRHGHLPPPEPAQPPSHAMVSMHWHQRMHQGAVPAPAASWQNWQMQQDQQYHWPSSEPSSGSRGVVQPLTALLMCITGLLQHQR